MTSLCTGKAIRAYFLDDKLPENGLWCETDEVLFPPKAPDVAASVDAWFKEPASSYPEDDLRLLSMLRDLGQILEPYVGDFRRPRSLK